MSTLYTHFAALLDAQAKSNTSALASQKEVILALKEVHTHSHAVVEKRLEGMKEFRSTLQDLFEERIKGLENDRAQRGGKSEGLSLGWAIISVAAGIAGTLYGILK